MGIVGGLYITLGVLLRVFYLTHLKSTYTLKISRYFIMIGSFNVVIASLRIFFKELDFVLYNIAALSIAIFGILVLNGFKRNMRDFIRS
jgi:hypothetical protein